MAARLAKELGAPLPPIDVHSLEFTRWVSTNASIAEEARRVVDGEEAP